MYKPYTFMNDSIRYITLIGLEYNDTIKASDVMNYKNAMPFSVFMTSKVNPKLNMEKQAGCQLNSLPILKPTKFEEAEGVYSVEAEIDGKSFVLTPTAVIIGGEVVCGEGEVPATKPVEEVKPETVPAAAEEKTASPGKVPNSKLVAKEAEPVVKEEEVAVVSEPEPIKEEPAVVSSPEPNPVVQKESNLVGTERLEPAPAPQPEEDDEQFYGLKIGGGSVKQEQIMLGAAVVDSCLEAGVEFSSPTSYSQPHMRRRDTFMETRPAQTKQRYPWQRADDVEENDKAQPEQPFVPSGVPTVAPDIVEKKQEEAWAKNTPVDKNDKWEKLNAMAPSVSEEPAEIAPQEPVSTQPDENKELKEAFRSTLSPEINKVIGDIPHSILGPIEAFTTNDIDLSQLEEQGDVYCIDRRWQKCGKWYCVDVVNHYARYFYNSKLGVSIEIPTATCKEWLNIVSGNAQ